MIENEMVTGMRQTEQKGGHNGGARSHVRGSQKEAPTGVVIINVAGCDDDMEMPAHKDLVKLYGKRSAFL